ncbi:DUF2269 family protein [Phytopseudomonas punonensis]|uniref:Uncharacterized membrane protein n=1 Tax=Phytopseudomonas punonensis TaxID=1220495 RepID=A0A1M7A2I3_9GAMM|nr:DUF2269 family protein [Pseudomonas punonensis]SHL36860.1 Uncharacterized membrane protein [Pseudomonas punonensis]
MEHYLLIRVLHALPGILLLLGVLAHAFMLWKAWRAGDKAVLQRKLQRTRTISLPVFAVLALSLPVTGWWMVNLAGWPLSQLWLLLGSSLFAVLMIVGLLLLGRLGAWQAQADGAVPAKSLRFVVAYAALIVVLLVVIMAVMGAKPV